MSTLDDHYELLGGQLVFAARDGTRRLCANGIMFATHTHGDREALSEMLVDDFLERRGLTLDWNRFLFFVVYERLTKTPEPFPLDCQWLQATLDARLAAELDTPPH